jgi:hypothetical protein
MNEEEIRTKGQNKYSCCISGCEKTGRKFGKIGEIILSYCPEHRKIGEKILNYLLSSKRRSLRTKLLYKCKYSIMFEEEPKFCDECEKKLINLLQKGITEIDKNNEFIEYLEEEDEEKEPESVTSVGD